MIVKAYKTHKIKAGEDIFEILDKYLPALEENTVVVIASKIISLHQKNIVLNDGSISKEELVKQQADLYYLDNALTSFGLVVPSIVNNVLIANAGIDESNITEGFLLWPKDIENITNNIWKHLRKKHTLKNLGVLITDSRLTPLVFGITGVGISWCGFEALYDYRGKKDIFGKKLKMTQKNLINGFANAAVVVTGEGDEQTPLATITDIPFVKFQNRPPTQEEYDKLVISKEDDIYGKMLTSVKWIKGGKKS